MISIIIPVYNVEKYIDKCIESCLNQSYTDFELIAVNDGSTDSSGNILDSYQLKDSRIKVIHKQNEGAAKSRIIGLNEAKGEFICFLDSDDTLPYNSLQVLYNNLKEENSDIAIGIYCECYPNGNKKYSYYNEYKTIDIEVYLKLLLLDKIPNGACAKLYKKNLIINPTVTYYKLGEDTTLLVQIISNAKKISFINENVYNYLQRNDSAVHIKRPSYLADMYYYRVWVVDYLKNIKNIQLDNLLFEIYLIRGYIRCVFWGGRDLFSKEFHNKMKEKYTVISKSIPLWEKYVFQTIPSPLLNKIVVKILHYIRLFIKKE